MPGDPDGGKTRVVTQNSNGAVYWVGKQTAGGQFEAMWNRTGAVGFCTNHAVPLPVPYRVSVFASAG